MEGLDRKVVERLDSMFSKRQIDVLKICPQIENHLFTLITDFILEEIQIFAENSQSEFKLISKNSIGKRGLLTSEEYFLFDKQIYELKIVGHPNKAETIVLTIRNPDIFFEEHHPKYQKIEISSLGRYTNILISADKFFLPRLNSFAEIARIVITVSYNRMKDYVLTEIEKLKDETGEALYAHLRRVFAANPSIMDHIWLYVEVEEHGIYTMDRNHREIALKRSAIRKKNINISPLELAVRLYTEQTPFEMTYSGESMVEDKTITGGLSSARYVASGIQIAEERLYKGDLHSCQPLVRENRNMLSACYPTQLIDVIEPVLIQERQALKEILNQRIFSIKRIIDQIKKQEIRLNLPPQLFEWAGSLMKGLFGI